MGQGLFGLVLDARYGILPYAPVYLFAAGGALLRGRGPSRLRWALPAMAAYYVTVASADNWSGAVCNLGRYFMPVAPWLAAAVAAALAAAGRRRGVLAVALALVGWTALFAAALWADPHAANDCALLLNRSAFADGNLYVPNLFLRTWSEAAPGLFVRMALGYPDDPKGALRRLATNVDALAADDEFAQFRDTPGVFREVAELEVLHGPVYGGA